MYSRINFPSYRSLLTLIDPWPKYWTNVYGDMVDWFGAISQIYRLPTISIQGLGDAIDVVGIHESPKNDETLSSKPWATKIIH